MVNVVQPTEAQAASATLCAAQQNRLLQHIEHHFDDPALRPASAAAALGWSLRQVHAVLDGGPQSFMRCVTRLRLQRARVLLLQKRSLVIDVAFACGFDSLATFYRHYVAAFGSTPAAERRLQGSTPHPPNCGDAGGVCTE